MPQKKQSAKQAAQPPPQVSMAEAADPFGAVVQLVDKKVRNMEKRKSRLETLKSEQSEGKQLDRDQAMAVSKLEFVDEQLLALKDLQKGIMTIQQESQKYKKKQEKAEAVQLKEAQWEAGKTAIAGTLRITSALTLIDEEAKEELKEGKDDAPQLSEVELDALDTFYNLVDTATIRGQAEGLTTSFSAVSEHLQLCLERSGKEVPGTDGQTYKRLAEILDQLESSGYLAKLSEAAAVEEADEGEEVGQEGGANVEEYDVINDEDIPSTEQVQAILEITQQQDLRRQQQAAAGGVTQDLPLGSSSFNPGLSHVPQGPPSGGYMTSGGFPSTAVDFPGLDPNSDSGDFSFMHKSEVVPTSPPAPPHGGTSVYPAQAVDPSPSQQGMEDDYGQKAQLDEGQGRSGGSSSEQTTSYPAGGFPPGGRGKPRDQGNRRFNSNGSGGGHRGNGSRGSYPGRRGGGRGGGGRGGFDRPYNQEGRGSYQERQGDWPQHKGSARGGGGGGGSGRRGPERQT